MKGYALIEKRGSRSVNFDVLEGVTGSRKIARGKYYITLADDDSDEFEQLKSQRVVSALRQVLAINGDSKKIDSLKKRYEGSKMLSLSGNFTTEAIKAIKGRYSWGARDSDAIVHKGAVKPAMINFDSMNMATPSFIQNDVIPLMLACPKDTLLCLNVCLNSAADLGQHVFSNLTFALRSSHCMAMDAQDAIFRELTAHRQAYYWERPAMPNEYICTGKKTKMATLYFYKVK